MKKIENDINGRERVQFESTLLKVSDNILTNKNGKDYRVCSIEFADVNGVIQQSSALMFESNFKHGVQPGKKYLTTATFTEQDGEPSVIVNVSHLEANADRPSIEMFLGAVASATTETVKEKGTLVS